MAWFGFNLNGRLGVFVSGELGLWPIGHYSTLYRHNQDGGFWYVTNLMPTGLANLPFKSLATAHYDKDGRMDLLIAGMLTTHISHNKSSGPIAYSSRQLVIESRYGPDWDNVAALPA